MVTDANCYTTEEVYFGKAKDVVGELRSKLFSLFGEI